MIGALDAAAVPIKQRECGFGAGELLTGIAVAQLAGEDFLTEPTASASMRPGGRSRRNCHTTPFRSLRRPAS